YVTDLRRTFWGHTALGPHFLEYTGRGRELLIGFLMALAVIVPMNIVVAVVTLEQGMQGEVISLAFAGVFLFLVQFALYRARRYRLTRTIFRGLRFWQGGSGLLYALRVFLWAVPVLATFGIVWPFALADLERYKMRHTHYGTLNGAFTGTGAGFLKSAGWIWLVMLGPLLFAAIGFLITLDFSVGFDAIIAALSSSQALTAGNSPVNTAALGGLIATLVWAMVIGFFLYPFYQALRFRWWANGVRFGPVALESTLKPGGLYSSYALYIGSLWGAGFMLSFFIGLVSAFGALALNVPLEVTKQTPIGAGPSQELIETLTIIGVVVFYVVAALVYAALGIVVLQRLLWRTKAASLIVHNAGAIETAENRGHRSGSFGEGLADALDVGGF
ncbi:MAG: DUF898 family protein, partial [Hyphomicrobiaceae bacterium]|nr:DUF898 family protein [Hyphomicrobiaceae bacterium]